MRCEVQAGSCRHVAPCVSLTVTGLTVTGLTVAGERLDITIDSGGRVESVTAPAGLTVEEPAALRA
ncbi:hypothetical protein WBG99_20490 [Streptomyces sp. TG1A-60]|uniref:hypothetical protein n=1 Tax=Streptomyces sp. TG1A-60 TaxID=3129111 RepID=UPI0030CD825C